MLEFKGKKAKKAKKAKKGKDGGRMDVGMLFLFRDIVGMGLRRRHISCSLCMILLNLIRLFTLLIRFLIRIQICKTS